MYDPTSILHRMAEILEKETNAFIAGDPDPFEVRFYIMIPPGFSTAWPRYWKRRPMLSLPGILIPTRSDFIL